jgi:hypothetical protein
MKKCRVASGRTNCGIGGLFQSVSAHVPLERISSTQIHQHKTTKRVEEMAIRDLTKQSEHDTLSAQ